MRLSVFFSLVFVGVLLAEGTRSGSCGFVDKQHENPRGIRGYQPEYVSTAINFGKRQAAAARQDKYDNIIRLLQDYPQSFFTRWVLEELGKNPQLANRVARAIAGVDDIRGRVDDGGSSSRISELEENPDELSTADLYKSERTLSIF